MQPEPVLPPEVERLGRAIRFAFICFVVALSYLPIRAALSISAFDAAFRDMLHGHELPAITLFVIKTRDALIAVSFLAPLLALSTFLSRRLVASFYLLGAVCLLTIVLTLLMYRGLFTPLFQIIQEMQGG